MERKALYTSRRLLNVVLVCEFFTCFVFLLGQHQYVSKLASLEALKDRYLENL